MLSNTEYYVPDVQHRPDPVRLGLADRRQGAALDRGRPGHLWGVKAISVGGIRIHRRRVNVTATKVAPTPLAS